MILFTKKEIARIWLGDGNTTELCCPCCRDNLSVHKNKDGNKMLYCDNYMCLNTDVYSNKKDAEIIGKIKDIIPEWVCDKETK